MKNLKYLLLVLIICAACNEKKTESEKPEILLLATGDQSSGSTYFTKDESGNPVLCWTGRSVGDSTSRLEFAFYDRAGKRFNRKGTVSPTAGAVNSSESTNKIAFKSDGTMVAVLAGRLKMRKILLQEPSITPVLTTTAKAGAKKLFCTVPILRMHTNAAFLTWQDLRMEN